MIHNSTPILRGQVCFPTAFSILWLLSLQHVALGQQGAEYTISATEIIRIGDEAAGSAELFGQITSVAVDSKGNIFVAEMDGPPVRAFSPEGELLAVIGARGEGPGEYVRVAHLQVGHEDSVYVWDWRRGILVMFAPDTWAPSGQIQINSDDEGAPTGLVGISEHGPIVVFSLEYDLENLNAGRFRKAMLVDWSGAPVQELVRLPEIELKFSISEGGFGVREVPFGRFPEFQFGAGSLYSGWSETIDIQITSPAGESIGRIQMAHEPVPVTRTERSEILNPEVFDEIYSTKPAYQTFVVDDRGQVWIKDQVRDESMEVAWHVLDADGNEVGRARFPSNISVRVIRLEENKIYATTRADDESPIVVVYHVEM